MQLLTCTGTPGMGIHIEGVDLPARRWGFIIATGPLSHEAGRFACLLGKQHRSCVT
jgi:hypothetical protein